MSISGLENANRQLIDFSSNGHLKKKNPSLVVFPIVGYSTILCHRYLILHSVLYAYSLLILLIMFSSSVLRRKRYGRASSLNFSGLPPPLLMSRRLSCLWISPTFGTAKLRMSSHTWSYSSPSHKSGWLKCALYSTKPQFFLQRYWPLSAGKFINELLRISAIPSCKALRLGMGHFISYYLFLY